MTYNYIADDYIVNQIFDMITNQISNRFKDFEQLHFFLPYE
jgi:hypothetical protein